MSENGGNGRIYMRTFGVVNIWLLLFKWLNIKFQLTFQLSETYLPINHDIICKLKNKNILCIRPHVQVTSDWHTHTHSHIHWRAPICTETEVEKLHIYYCTRGMKTVFHEYADVEWFGSKGRLALRKRLDKFALMQHYMPFPFHTGKRETHSVYQSLEIH